MIYKTVTVGAQLSNNQVNTSANISSNSINANAQMINRMDVNNVSNYDLLTNKPLINSVTLQGDKSFEDLGLEGISNLELENILKI